MPAGELKGNGKGQGRGKGNGKGKGKGNGKDKGKRRTKCNVGLIWIKVQGQMPTSRYFFSEGKFLDQQQEEKRLSFE